MIASVIPLAAVGDKFLLIQPDRQPSEVPALLSNLASIPFDYVTRQKLGSTSLKYFTMKQLPVLSPDTYYNHAPWDDGGLLQDWLTPRVLELTYTAWDLEPFACDLGYNYPPFRWDPDRRFLLRCELDAAFFHLYGIEREDADYIMETFPIVKRRDEAAHGEYRTKRVILEIYDQMVRAAETGEPYQTPLDPPPVELDLDSGESVPATVTPLRTHEKRPYPQPEESRSASIAAEETTPYGQGINTDTNNFTRGQPRLDEPEE